MMPSITSGEHSKSVQHTGLKSPDRNQAVDVLGVDLIERAEALGIVRAAVHQPVGVIGAGFQKIIFIDGTDRLGWLLPGCIWPEGTEPGS